MAVEQLLWTFCAVQIEPVGPTYVNLEMHNNNNNNNNNNINNNNKKVGTIIIIIIIIPVLALVSWS